MAGKKTTALATYDKELAALAQMGQKTAAERAGSSGGTFIGTEGGSFKIDGVVLKEKEIDVVVSDFILENAFYEGTYDPKNPQPPVCFAFGREEGEMAPHDDSTDKQADACADCPQNEWGSAPTGRGKACKNIVRLGLISADDIQNVEDIPKADVRYLKVPITSTKNWAGHVEECADSLKMPVQVAITSIEIGAAPKGGHQLTFGCGEKITDSAVIGALIEKHKAVAEEIDFPYQPADEEQEEKPQRGGRGGGKPSPAKQPIKPARGAGGAKAPAGRGGFGGSNRAAKY